MTTICSLLSSAILVRMLYYLPIDLSIRFVTAFGHLAAVLLKKEQFFGRPLLYRSSTYLPEIERVSWQSERDKDNPNSDLQTVWGSRWNFHLSFLLQQLGAAGSRQYRLQ